MLIKLYAKTCLPRVGVAR